MDKKGAELTLNYLVVAIIALIVLVVVLIVFRKPIGIFVDNILELLSGLEPGLEVPKP